MSSKRRAVLIAKCCSIVAGPRLIRPGAGSWIYCWARSKMAEHSEGSRGQETIVSLATESGVLLDALLQGHGSGGKGTASATRLALGRKCDSGPKTAFAAQVMYSSGRGGSDALVLVEVDGQNGNGVGGLGCRRHRVSSVGRWFWVVWELSRYHSPRLAWILSATGGGSCDSSRPFNVSLLC